MLQGIKDALTEGKPAYTPEKLQAAMDAFNKEMQAKADARFKNKDVAITGTVADVRRDYRGDLMLRLATGDALETVQLTFT